jgi:hypothetical protein
LRGKTRELLRRGREGDRHLLGMKRESGQAQKRHHHCMPPPIPNAALRYPACLFTHPPVLPFDSWYDFPCGLYHHAYVNNTDFLILTQ